MDASLRGRDLASQGRYGCGSQWWWDWSCREARGSGSGAAGAVAPPLQSQYACRIAGRDMCLLHNGLARPQLRSSLAECNAMMQSPGCLVTSASDWQNRCVRWRHIVFSHSFPRPQSFPVFPPRRTARSAPCAGSPVRARTGSAHARTTREQRWMPRRADPRSILILGTGPIVIGQAAEFATAARKPCGRCARRWDRGSLFNSNRGHKGSSGKNIYLPQKTHSLPV